MSRRELEAAVQRVVAALEVGPNPRSRAHSTATQRRHEREWRGLHDALHGLRAAATREGITPD
jgi:hypothetical protein